MQCVFHGPLLANGSWRVGGRTGGFFLVAEAAVDIHMRMKGATRSSPAVGVGPPRPPKQVQRSAGLEGTTATMRTCPWRSLGKTRRTLSVAAQLESSRSSILSALLEAEQTKDTFTGHLARHIFRSGVALSPSVFCLSLLPVVEDEKTTARTQNTDMRARGKTSGHVCLLHSGNLWLDAVVVKSSGPLVPSPRVIIFIHRQR